ncbi:uncharacterized protein LOC116219661 isoform X2 [Clupea harengus]|uniref:Uncharacterized protein LOC116219661 isoform X2 n=1 Tax=Clupea harengus TaxID=7950 RepID=A0A6P8F5L6_CLUHA|nr:uncharacterized protein LOC116219661 isoform X2 [Clupea harengus]
MNPSFHRRALTPIQESEDSAEHQCSSGIPHGELSSPSRPAQPTDRPSPDDQSDSSPEVWRSARSQRSQHTCQPHDLGFCENKSSPLELDRDSSSSTSELEHSKSSHEHVLEMMPKRFQLRKQKEHGALNQQPVESPAASPPRKNNKAPRARARKRKAKDDGEAGGQKRNGEQRGASTALEPSLPLWLVSLMHNIEEATQHELVVE